LYASEEILRKRTYVLVCPINLGKPSGYFVHH